MIAKKLESPATFSICGLLIAESSALISVERKSPISDDDWANDVSNKVVSGSFTANVRIILRQALSLWKRQFRRLDAALDSMPISIQGRLISD